MTHVRCSTNSEFLTAVSNAVAEHLGRSDKKHTVFDAVSYSIKEDNLGGTDIEFRFEVDYGEPATEDANK